MLLQGVKGISVYIDDIIISGATLEEYLSCLAEVFSWLENAGLRLNCEKCFILRSSVEYFGYTKSRQLKTPPIQQINSTQLRSFLGLLNYYNYRVIPTQSCS